MQQVDPMFSTGSLTLLRVRGVPIKAHWSLLVVVPWMAVTGATQFAGIAALAGVDAATVRLSPLAWGAVMSIGLFVSVALHELAHTLLALRFGGRVREITLMLLGGVSQFEHLPRRPRYEAMIAAAGPIASLALGGALLFALRLPLPPDVRLGCFYVGELNLMLAVFNLLPVFPMDGGRILRAGLSAKLGAGRGTRIAAGIGRVAAVALAVLALRMGAFTLLIVAAYLFVSAQAEAKNQRVRDTLAELRVDDLVAAPPATIRPDATLSEALGRMRQNERLDLIVVGDRGEPLGVVRAADVLELGAERRSTLRIANLDAPLASRGLIVTGREAVGAILERAAAQGAQYLLVVDGHGALAGVVGRRELEQAIRRPRPITATGTASTPAA